MSVDTKIVIKGDTQSLPELYHNTSDVLPKLTDDIIDRIGMGLEKAYEVEDVVKLIGLPQSLFDEWYHAGKALAERRSHSALPILLPHQPGESIDEYNARKEEWVEACNLLWRLYLTVNMKKSEANSELIDVIRNFAFSGHPDAPKFAERLLLLRDSPYRRGGNVTVDHKHEISGEVQHNHVDQIHGLMADFVGIMGSGNDGIRVIEGEVIEK